jgi:hypothetical protein
MLSKWDAITWTLVLAIVPYGWTVIGALLMCWMVLQLGSRKKPTPGGPIDGGGTTTYGDISSSVNLYHSGTHRHTTRTKSNRSVWKDFFDNDDF